ncbi:MAG: sulfite exporter TauE/SafE family protein [Candidatus Methanomethylophilaceae archaeon]|jgi:hypothetical protein|nr:sulfite exporter TauE/SafE family protein [Candidatus Methanomethylophilaceae archaeon]MDD3127696.1 sulfite exporter TauE/SafE family protein [Candidatus Methanomethylophilaceae archaeon]MDD4119176.1 sulfite exporter TauE/SafE family protein [Candidatus Methanomethylophilaceae archaeon]MDD4453727.1 sulfite exporter TauE/SafE family protein [Candidatus Methanomethylophilaceae archaeon]
MKTVIAFIVDPLLLLGLVILGIVAGILGALLGVGGGIIFIPVLTIVYGLTPVSAAALSLVGIIAISSWGSAIYLNKGVPNIRIGLMLEIGGVTGAIIGAMVAVYLEDWILMAVFSVVMIFSAYRMIRNGGSENIPENGDGEFEYNDLKCGETVCYDVEHKTGGTIGSMFAGMISSLTGVGGGVIKVPIMNIYMKMPIKAAAATSSYSLGITAFSGAVVYLIHGSVPLGMAAFLIIGSVIGAEAGTRISARIDASSLKKYFSLLLMASAVLMLLHAGGYV